jgi:hypothetical protein
LVVATIAEIGATTPKWDACNDKSGVNEGDQLPTRGTPLTAPPKSSSLKSISCLERRNYSGGRYASPMLAAGEVGDMRAALSFAAPPEQLLYS